MKDTLMILAVGAILVLLCIDRFTDVFDNMAKPKAEPRAPAFSDVQSDRKVSENTLAYVVLSVPMTTQTITHVEMRNSDGTWGSVVTLPANNTFRLKAEFGSFNPDTGLAEIKEKKW